MYIYILDYIINVNTMFNKLANYNIHKVCQINYENENNIIF